MLIELSTNMIIMQKKICLNEMNALYLGWDFHHADGLGRRHIEDIQQLGIALFRLFVEPLNHFVNFAIH